jgi:hypothetical protein
MAFSQVKYRVREAVTICIARIEEVNSQVNAVVDLLADEALADADRADAAESPSTRSTVTRSRLRSMSTVRGGPLLMESPLSGIELPAQAVRQSLPCVKLEQPSSSAPTFQRSAPFTSATMRCTDGR